MANQFLDDGDEVESGFQINKAYASKYDNWRRAEELQKFKDKFGDAALDSDGSSESSEVEDNNAREDTPEKERGFFNVLSILKSQDPRIYEKSTTFFNDTNSAPKDPRSSEQLQKRNKTAGPMYLQDYERKVLLEKGGHYSDEEDRDVPCSSSVNGITYAEETKQIKQSFKQLLSNDGDDNDDGELLTKRVKCDTEKKREEEDYLEWLKGQKAMAPETVERDLKPLKEFWSRPDLDDSERFLRDYILEKRYRNDCEDGEERGIPSYEEIVGGEDLPSFDEEEEMLERQDQFEHKYNFRFENPDPEFIKQYPRTIADSLRRKDDKRKQQREAHRKNVAEAKKKLRDERKQMKALKRNEIMEKIQRVQRIAGEELPFKPEDIDGDFDPAEYDRKMQEYFASNYYENATADNAEEEEKPVFSDSESEEESSDDAEFYDQWQPEQRLQEAVENAGPSYSNPAVNAIASSSRLDDSSDQKNCVGPQVRNRKKRKRHSHFLDAISTEKPVFDPNEKTFEQYFNEYYQLDYEDIVGGMPCRFKYRDVEANDFGLSTDEVLVARDQELNAWVSLKKMTQYRAENEEKSDLEAYRRKAKNEFKKAKTLKSIYEMREPAGEEQMEDAEILKAKQESGIVALSPEEEEEEKTPGKRRRKRAKKVDTNVTAGTQSYAANDRDKPVTLHRQKKAKRPTSEAKQVTSKPEVTSKPKMTSKPKVTSTPKLAVVAASAASEAEARTTELSKSQRRKLRKRQSKSEPPRPRTLKDTVELIQHMPNDRLLAYGVNPKKMKAQIKYSKKFRDI